MRKIVLIILIVISAIGCKDKPDALDYNIKLSQQNDRVVEAVTSFFAQMENDDFERAEKERLHVIQVCDSVITEMVQLGGFEADKQLVIALQSYVEMQKELAQNEFKQLLVANNTIDKINSTTEQLDLEAIAAAYLTIDSVRESINYKDSIHYIKAATVQRKFALQHGFNIEDEPTEEGSN